MTPLTLFLLGVTIGLGIALGRALATLVVGVVESLYWAIRWHVYRPLLRRAYLRRVAKYRGTVEERIERHAAMARHPSAGPHNRSLS